MIPLIRHALNEASVTDDDFSKMVDASLLDFIKLASPLLVMQAHPVFQIIDNITYKENQSENFFIRPDGLTAIKVSEPDDLCRFIALKATSWNYPVTLVYADTDPLFKNQYSSVPGIGCGASSPLIFLSSMINNEGLLQTYFIGHAIESPEPFVFSYVKNPSVTETEINMNEILANPLAYYTASLYLQSIQDINGSKAAYDTAQLLVQELNKNIAS